MILSPNPCRETGKVMPRIILPLVPVSRPAAGGKTQLPKVVTQ